MAELPTFKGLWPWPWIGPYCIPSCITRRLLPTHQISLKSKKFFVDGRTDGRMDGRVDGHLRPTLLGRLRGVDLITNAKNNTHLWIIIRLAFKTVCHYACFEGEICPKLGKTSLIPTWGGRRSRTTTNIRIWKLFCALSVTYSISSRFNSLMSGKFSPKHTLVLVKLATKCFHE